jgi:hypothetical protein
MASSEKFLFGGLRARLERSAAIRPRTIPQVVVGQRPDWVHAQVHFNRAPAPALRPRVVRTQPLFGVR